MRAILAPIIVALALAVGLVHLLLVFQLYVFAPSRLPGGGPPPQSVATLSASSTLSGSSTIVRRIAGAAPPSPGSTRGSRPPGGFPRGGGSPLLAHLPQLFVLNFLGFTALAAGFLVVRRAIVTHRLIVDVLLWLMALATLIGWFSAGRPNPRHLGTVAVLLELALIAAVIIHASILLRSQFGQPAAIGPR